MIREPSANERAARRWVLAAILLCMAGLLSCGVFGLTLCGGSGSPWLWGVPFVGALGCALRADAAHLGIALRTMRGCALLFAGFFAVVAMGLTAIDILSRPPSVDYTPPVVAIAGVSPGAHPHRVARCSD